MLNEVLKSCKKQYLQVKAGVKQQEIKGQVATSYDFV